MKSLPITDLREDLTNMVEYVARREEPLLITRHGKAVAVLAPHEPKVEKIIKRQWLLGNVNAATSLKAAQ